METEPLQVRSFGEQAGDWDTVSGWWAARQDAGVFTETLLPPLGVVVERGGEPLAAVWAYEAYGVGVAFIEFPCTQPGLAPKLAAAALMMAEECVARILREKNTHALIVAHTRPHIARSLAHLGYLRASEGVVTMMRRVD